MEAGIALDTCQVQGDNGNLLHVCFLQGTTDEADIVRRTASATGLAHDDGCLVQVIFTGQQSFHDLTYYQQGRIAGIIVNIFQTNIHRVLVIVVQYHEIVTAGIERRLQDLKVDRGHLRTDDGIVLTHLFGKRYLLDSGRTDVAVLAHLFTDTDCRQQGTDTDTGRTQVVDFIDLQAGVDLVGAGEDIVHLIGGNGIQTAAEGIQLDQIQILHRLYIACGSVKSGMVHPLVGYNQRTFRFCQMGDGILCQYCHIVGGDQLGNTVVDLRVYMIGTACQHDTALAGLA